MVHEFCFAFPFDKESVAATVSGAQDFTEGVYSQGKLKMEKASYGVLPRQNLIVEKEQFTTVRVILSFESSKRGWR